MGRLPFMLWLWGYQGALTGLSVTAHLQIKVMLNDAVHQDAIGEQIPPPGLPGQPTQGTSPPPFLFLFPSYA